MLLVSVPHWRTGNPIHTSNSSEDNSGIVVVLLIAVIVGEKDFAARLDVQSGFVDNALIGSLNDAPVGFGENNLSSVGEEKWATVSDCLRWLWSGIALPGPNPDPNHRLRYANQILGSVSFTCKAPELKNLPVWCDYEEWRKYMDRTGQSVL